MKNFILKFSVSLDNIKNTLLENNIEIIYELTIINSLIIRCDNNKIEKIKKIFYNKIISLSEDDYNYQLTSRRRISSGGNWGVDRIDQEELPLDNIFFTTRKGSNADVYIPDTGINPIHKEFGERNGLPRVKRLFDFRNQFLKPSESNFVSVNDFSYANDDEGHGTGIASLVGGKNAGVASECNLYSVKIFNSFRFSKTSWILGGIQEIFNHHQNKGNNRPSIVNLSFTNNSTDDLLVENAIRNLINNNVIVLSSSGDTSDNVNIYTPQKINELIVVGSTKINDVVFDKSNFGSNIDFFAPGVDLQVADKSEPNKRSNSYKTVTGSSYAVGLATGVASLYLEFNNNDTQMDVKQFFKDNNNKDKLTNVPKNSPNELLYQPFQDSMIGFITNPGVILTPAEKTKIEFQFDAKARNLFGENLDVTYEFISGDLPPNVNLQKNGKLNGELPSIDYKTPGYFFVEALTKQSQENFSENVKGFKDYTFDVAAKSSLSSVVETFTIRVLDINESPKWVMSTNILNDLFPQNDWKVNEIIDINLNDSTIIKDADQDPLFFSLLNGRLPPGLELTENGKITGELKTFPTVGENISNSRKYSFHIRVFDGITYNDQQFVVTISRSGTNDLPTWITPPWRREDPNNPGNFIYSNIGEFFNGLFITTNVEAQSGENSNFLKYSKVPLNDPDVPNQYSPTATPNSYVIGDDVIIHDLPVGLSVKENGEIIGNIEASNLPGFYYFTIEVFDGFVSVPRTFRILIKDFSKDSPLSSIIITSNRNLGIIRETEYSYFTIKAKSFENKKINFRLAQSSQPLPPGLYLEEKSGRIKGYVDYVNNDTNFIFNVEAYFANNPSIYSIQRFSISVKKTFTNEISDIKYFLTGNNKYDYINWIANKNFFDIVDRKFIFLDGDNFYGRVIEPEIFILGGLPVVNKNELYDVVKLQNNNNVFSTFYSPITLIMGSMKNAKGHDDNGNHIFDIIYIELYDPNENAGGYDDNDNIEQIIYPHNPGTNIRNINNVYPPSLKNWRTDFKAKLGLNSNEEKLPMWMRNPQDPNNPDTKIGFLPCIEVMYVQPDTSNVVMFELRRQGDIDRFKNKTITIDHIVNVDLTNPNRRIKQDIDFPPSNVIT